MASFGDLPAELFLRVLSYLGIKDLAAVALTCRGHYTLANSPLYELEAWDRFSYTFYAAAQSGDVGRMQKLIDAGFDVNRRWYSEFLWSYSEDKQLMDRWYEGKCTNEEVLRQYSEKGAAKSTWYRRWCDDISSQLDLDWGLLESDKDRRLAWRKFFQPKMRRLAPFGETWWTALHLAAANGKDDAVALLLDNGANISSSSFGVCDCLQVEAYLNNHNVDRRYEPSLWSPLHVAICCGKSSTFSTVRLLLQRGAPITVETNEPENLYYDGEQQSRGQCTALHAACFYGPHLLVEWLVECGYQSDIYVKDRLGQTPLAYAFCASGFATVEYLLKKGADINITLGKNANAACTGPPLVMACKASKYADAIELVKLGADVNSIDSLRYSSLHILAMRTGWMNREEKGKLVYEPLKKGARVDSVDSQGYTPLCYAKDRQNVDIAELLIQYGAKSV